MTEKTELFSQKDKLIVAGACLAAWEEAVETAQVFFDAADHGAARNGNAWWQGRIGALQDVIRALEDLAQAARERKETIDKLDQGDLA